MKSEDHEIGPLTRALKAEEELALSEAQRHKDNEYLLGQIGELKGEIDRLSAVEELAFEYGTHLKCLVTSLCPVIKGTMVGSNRDWDEMTKCWEIARDRLGLNEDGLKIEPVPITVPSSHH